MPTPALEKTSKLLATARATVLAPLSWVAEWVYVHDVAAINNWYDNAWRWSEEDCNIDFILARKEDVLKLQEEELEDAYERYVSWCRWCLAVPIEPLID